MPISKKWSIMKAERIETRVPERDGVYELTSFGADRALYIGKTRNLKRRLREHLNERKPNRYRYVMSSFLQSTDSMEKDHFERYVQKYGETPPWNSQDPRTPQGVFG
jgi:hypothetical protein